MNNSLKLPSIDYKEFKILTLCKNKEFANINHMAEELKVTTRSVRTYIKQLNENLGEDIAQIAEGGARAVSSIPDKVDDAIVFVTGKPLYGDPIEKYSGDRASVFAVGNGQVTAAGENETIGKYVKITHGSDGESLYGNLDEVFAKVPSNVKKGQIIGTYRESAGKDFYYSFTEFD